jgi:PmbA protein
MSQELLAKAKEVVRAAQQRGAQAAKANLSRNRSSRIECLDGKLDRLRESTSMGLAVSLYVDGRYSSNSTSDMRPEALATFLDETMAMTRLLAPDPHRKLPDPSRYANRFAGDLQLFDGPGHASVTGIDLRRMAEALDQGARSAPGADRIAAVQSSGSDWLYESALVTSNGMEGTAAATSFSLYLRTTLQDDTGGKPMDYAVSASLFRSDLGDPLAVGAESTRRALSMLGMQPMPSGRYPCVIENRVAERAMDGLLDPLNGGLIQQKQSFLADKLGQQIASPALTIIDEPHRVRGFGSSAFDDEGMSTYKRPIFERGVVRGFFLDTYSASKLGVEPTSGSSTNLVFQLGNRDLDGLLRAMGTGILITDFIGGNSNTTTGDFSVGVRGQWIEKGQRVRPIAGMNLSGNHLQAWQQLVEAGNDPYPYSDKLFPSLRFGELEFAGS